MNRRNHKLEKREEIILNLGRKAAVEELKAYIDKVMGYKMEDSKKLQLIKRHMVGLTSFLQFKDDME